MPCRTGVGLRIDKRGQRQRERHERRSVNGQARLIERVLVAQQLDALNGELIEFEIFPCSRRRARGAVDFGLRSTLKRALTWVRVGSSEMNRSTLLIR